jgi:hypothetical protein
MCVWAALQCGSCSTVANESVQRWPADKASAWSAQRDWFAGFNYVPSTACNTTEFWGEETFDPATITRELGWARDLGFRSCRVFIQYIVWKDNPEAFKERFTQFLDIAAGKGISVMPVLFDDCAFGRPQEFDPYLGKQRDPIPGMGMSSWTPSPGIKLGNSAEERPSLERYVRDMVGSYRADGRILLWDLWNEPVLGRVGTPERVREVFQWARKEDPKQPLTIGVWTGGGEYEAIEAAELAGSDIITFHYYGAYDGLKERIAHFEKFGRPVICTEWMARTMGARWDTDLPLFAAEKVPCYNWGLVNGRTQCQFPLDSEPGSPEPELWYHDLFRKDGTPYDPKEHDVLREVTGVTGTPSTTAPSPLFVDPVYDGAADPTLIWNREEKAWWIFYTARRANESGEPGVRWCHGTDIGIAASNNGGRTWHYRGIARGLAFEPGQNTWWAPEVIWHGDRYHMFVSYVPGMRDDWSGARRILHYTSANLIDWNLEAPLPLSSERVIDPCVFQFPDGTWRMWYKDEAVGSHIYLAESPDLYSWKVSGTAEASRAQEAPNVFRLGGFYWMLTDHGGMSLYRSTDALSWQGQGDFMQEKGKRKDDNWVAQHPDVVVLGDTAYILYFVHPFGDKHVDPDKHRSVLQIAQLETRDGKLVAVRDEPFELNLVAPPHGLYHGDGTPYDPKEHDVIREVTGATASTPTPTPAPAFVDPVYDSATELAHVTYRGIRPTDPNGRIGLRNPERGFRTETLIAEPVGRTEGVWGIPAHLRGRVGPG